MSSGALGSAVGACFRRARQEAPCRARTKRIIITETNNVIEKPLSSPLPHEHGPSTHRGGISIHRAVVALWNAPIQRLGLLRFVAQHKPRHSEKRCGAPPLWLIPSTARSMMVGRFSPGADGRLPIQPRCGRVYDQFNSFSSTPVGLHETVGGLGASSRDLHTARGPLKMPRRRATLEFEFNSNSYVS